ncbi:MAG TPA: hypothetical protein VLZ31_05005 [Microbacteriaceae bacterium]|nr:hypothetical protein [Microbacteriaceae bacterium]
MGYFVYSSVEEYEVEDRALSHLKLAVAYKLRRQESFLVSWSKPVEKGSGRVSVWVSPYVAIAFRFAGSRPPEINPIWVEALKQLSQTSRGLILISEKEAEEYMYKNPVPGIIIPGNSI